MSLGSHIVFSLRFYNILLIILSRGHDIDEGRDDLFKVKLFIWPNLWLVNKKSNYSDKHWH